MGKKDLFIDEYSMKEWDWYNNGENPNTKEYKTILWNSTVVVNGVKRFTGDLGKERLNFLLKLSEQASNIIILSERNIPHYFFSMGNVYKLSFQKDYVMDWKITKRKQTKVRVNPVQTPNNILNEHLNYIPKQE